MKKSLPVLALCILFVVTSFGQFTGRSISKTGTTAAAFLEIPVGARAIGMGGAFVATANDVTSLYWNPAGVARLDHSEVIFSHTNWIADLNFDYAAVSIPIEDFGTLGLSFTSLTMPDMFVRTVERPEGTGELFTAASFAMATHYSRNLTDKFSIGFTVKYISESIWDMNAYGFAVDVGTLFTTNFLNGMRVGASISNFGTDMKLAGRNTRTFHSVDPTKQGSNDQIPQNIEMDAWHLPLSIQFGIAVDAIKSDENLLTVAVDALHPADNYESLNVGIEYGFQNILFIRGGYQSLLLTDAEGGFSAGAGILTDLFGAGMKARADYAYNDFGRFKSVHVFALSVLF